MIYIDERILVLCALPYTNSIPHIGNIVGSHLPADIFARFCRLKRKKVLFIGGTDENGTPTEVAAIELNVSPKKLTDKLYKIHKKIYEWFSISYDNFSRTSRKVHHRIVQDFFKVLYKKGFIVEEEIELPYCENDKIYLADRYVEGICPYCNYQFARGDQCENCTKLLDPIQLKDMKCKICKKTPKIKKVKHLFLNLKKVEKRLKSWIEKQDWKKHVKNLALAWINEGLKKRCITRDLRWGVKVPLKNYERKIFYVWFDAPIGYISSTFEYFLKKKKLKEWEKFWKNKNSKIYNFLGKDNIPFHTIFWPGMLIANSQFNLPFKVVGLNYCNYEGQKISKSKKWGIFCEKILEANLKPDYWRYYLTYLIPETSDTEFKWKEFKEKINGELIGNFSNFFYRCVSFSYKNFGKKLSQKISSSEKNVIENVWKRVYEYEKLMEKVELRRAFAKIFEICRIGNKFFQKRKPWEDSDIEKVKRTLICCLNICKIAAILSFPFLPSTSSQILKTLNKKLDWERIFKIDERFKISKPKILFEKIEEKNLENIKNIVTSPIDIREYLK